MERLVSRCGPPAVQFSNFIGPDGMRILEGVMSRMTALEDLGMVSECVSVCKSYTHTHPHAGR